MNAAVLPGPRPWRVLAIALAFAAGGCALTRTEPVAGAPAGTSVVKVFGFRPASVPPDSRTASPGVTELEGSLRRIVVRYIKYTVLFSTDPQPLLSEEQIAAYAKILARELPTLGDSERLRFRFTDRHFGKGYDVEFDVYREGTALVYWFTALASSSATTASTTGSSVFMAKLEQGATGQEVANRETYAYMKDPLLGEERAQAAEREAKQRQFEQARQSADFKPEEEAGLAAILARSRPTAAVWKTYWERRSTLKRALEQGLMERAGYDAQVERLTAELEKSEE